jgi:hypothetical protein
VLSSYKIFPYVGIIQIRLWVKAYAYSQPTVVSSPLLSKNSVTVQNQNSYRIVHLLSRVKR